MLEARNEELELACVGMLDLKHKIEYLENKDKCNKEVESSLRTQLSEVEETLRAYKSLLMFLRWNLIRNLISTKPV